MSEECECEECPEEGLPAWMGTFADLMSLLMCFFVLLLSFSQMDAIKFAKVAGSMREAFGVQSMIEASSIPKGTSFIEQHYSPGDPKPTIIKVIQQETIDVVRDNLKTIDPVSEDVEKTAGKLIDTLYDEIKDGSLEIAVDGEKLLVRINDQGSFGSGSANLQADFKTILDKMSKVLKSSPGDIIVAGHTDDRPIRTRQYPSNWILSSARAAGVVHYLSSHSTIDKSRMQIRAHADAKPLVPNTSSENRAKNRRIEISIDTASESMGEANAVKEEANNLLQDIFPSDEFPIPVEGQ